jgi:hypothetical protein
MIAAAITVTSYLIYLEDQTDVGAEILAVVRPARCFALPRFFSSHDISHHFTPHASQLPMMAPNSRIDRLFVWHLSINHNADSDTCLYLS